MSKKKNKTTIENRAEIAAFDIIENAKAAALFIGRSSRTLRRWRKEGMLMAVKDGKPVYIKSQLQLFAANEGKKPTETKLKKEVGSAELTATKAERERWEFERDRGEWVRKDEVDRDNLRKIMTVKRTLLGQGRKLAMKLASMTNPRKIQKMLDDENRTIIEGFSR